MKHCIVLLGVFLLNGVVFSQQPVIRVTDQTDVLLIGKQVSFLEDPSTELTFEDIQKPENQAKFQQQQQDVFAHRISKTATWFKIIVQNQTDEDIWLNAGGSFTCWTIDFYRPDSAGNYSVVETGPLRPIENKEHRSYFYWLHLAEDHDTTIHTYYLRLTSGNPRQYPLEIGTLDALHKHKEIFDYLRGGYVGLMLIMILYNFFLAGATKDRLYFIYVGYLITALVNVVFDNNYSFIMQPWMWNYYLVWHNLFFFFIGWFAVRYLDLSKNAPRLYRTVWIAAIIISVVIPILNLAGIQITILTSFFEISIVIYTAILIGAGLYLWRKGNKNAFFYLLGWSFALAGIITITLNLNGIIPYNIFTRNALYFGFSLEILVFSLALANRVNTMRKEREASQRALLIKTQENEKILAQQNEILAIKVEERTKDLNQKAIELKEAYEEIQVTNEELNATVEELGVTLEAVNEQKNIIEQHNKRIHQSLNYARTIQDTILPEENALKQAFDEHFVIYRPKDVVSGDFYWLYILENNPKKILFVVADCTGHGVVGAFTTLVGANLLNHLINNTNTADPALMLNKIDEQFEIAVKQKERNNYYEGMEMSVMYIEQTTDNNFKIVYAGAKHPLNYIAKNEWNELTPTRRAIGSKSKTEPFTNQEITLPKGTILYLMSDGFKDQNNEERKKFGSEKLRNILVQFQTDATPLPDQKVILEKILADFQGYSEQRDDITLIGVKL